MEIPTLPASGKPPLTSKPAVVLDTNVVLDWLLFHEPGVTALSVAVRTGQVRWLATPAMRDELAHVLARGLAARRQADANLLLGGFDTYAALEPAGPTHPLQCSDADDQKFVDLAFAAGARWLVSRDRALLRMAGRAAARGLAILSPERWEPVPQ